MRKMEAAIKKIRDNNEATSLYTIRNAAHGSSLSASASASSSSSSSSSSSVDAFQPNQYKTMPLPPDEMAAAQQLKSAIRADAPGGTSNKAKGVRGKDRKQRAPASEMTCKVCNTKGCKGAFIRKNCQHKKKAAGKGSSSSSSSDGSSSGSSDTD